MSSRLAPAVRAICYRPNRGKGYAVRTGMLEAKGAYRLFADAGMCVPFAEIEKGLALLESGADVAIGSRKLAGSQIIEPQAGYRQAGSAIFGWLVRNWMGLRYSDTQCGFKLFTAQAAERLFSAARIDGFMFDAETLINARKSGFVVLDLAAKQDVADLFDAGAGLLHAIDSADVGICASWFRIARIFLYIRDG